MNETTQTDFEKLHALARDGCNITTNKTTIATTAPILHRTQQCGVYNITIICKQNKQLRLRNFWGRAVSSFCF